MQSLFDRIGRALPAVVVLWALSGVGNAGEGDWSEFQGLGPWKSPTGDWRVVGSVGLDAQNPKRLAAEAGEGILVNGPIGRTRNLLTKERYGDVEVRLEFMVPKGSNSGIKFEGLYEVQIADSFGVKTPTASDCGGIYPRAELLPTYHHIDDGVPPRTNPTRAPGEWQTLEVSFRAPRFDAGGKKVANARFEKVVLNGQVIHEGVALATPTGHAWHDTEVATGPLFLQADHGPVAFRNIRVRRLSDGTSR